MIFSPGSPASDGPDISGTPSAGNYARWSDADTLEARTTAQVLSDIGAQVAVVGVADVATAVKITTTIPTDGTGDGRYAVRLAICGNVPSHQILSFELSGGIIAGTAYASSEGPRLSNSGIAAPFIYTGGSYVEIYISQEGAGNYTFHVEAIGANYTTGWTITGSGSIAGSQATYRNQMMNVVLAGLGGTGHIVTQGSSNGIVSTQEIGAFLQALTGKTTPVGADGFAIFDSAASNAGKSLTLTNLVAALKTLIATDTLAAPTDVTTNNATSSAHGLLPKLSNVATEYLTGTGTWATPSGASFVGCSAYKDANQSITAQTWTAVSWPAEAFDSGTMHDNATNNSRITVPSTGKYLFGATVGRFDGAESLVLKWYVNGSEVQSAGVSSLYITDAYSTMTPVTILSLSANDYVELYIMSHTNTTITYDVNTTPATYFSNAVSNISCVKVG